MKKGKEVNVKLNKNFKTYYGTIDNKELKSIYVGVTTWITPLVDLENYSFVTSQLRRIIKTAVHQSINSQLFKTEQHIVDVDIKELRMGYDKSSYLNLEITLFTKNNGSILSNVIKMDMVRFITNILNSMEKSDNFKFSVKKAKNVSSI